MRARHVRRVRLEDPAVLRLDDREADRLGLRSRRRDRARRACAARDGRSKACRRRATSRSRCSRASRSASGDYSTSTLEALRAVDDVTISRRQARRQALFLLYQWDLSGQPIGSQYAGEIDTVGARRRRGGRRARARARRAHHRGVADGWTADRLGAVERSALRVAVHELETRRGPGRGRDQRGGRVHEALRIRRRGKAGERHPWTNPTGGGGMTER